MIESVFLRNLKRYFSFELTEMQTQAARQLCSFTYEESSHTAFILQGYAGTGKTTLMSAYVQLISKLGIRIVLMAPTGRAAKVFSGHSKKSAYTIHKIIYRQKKKDDPDAGFGLNINKYRNTIFIIDEASMIGNQPSMMSLFGSGNLLEDTLDFIYSAPGCKAIFVGDTAQLPPIGEDESPALSPECLKNLGFKVSCYQMTEVMRQAQKSGILHNATKLRIQLQQDKVFQYPSVRFHGFKDLQQMPMSELIDTLEYSYDHEGLEDTIVITRSNKRANAYNEGIRRTIFNYEEQLTRGDVLMIAKNNYYWAERLSSETDEEDVLPMDFIANGDIAIVKHIKKYSEFYGLHFADVTLAFPDYDDYEMEVRLILEALTSETPALSIEDSNKLFQGVMEDYADYPTKKKRMEKLREDPNYNALQVKYAYAVTCHKAQGGQWKHVFIDQGWLPDDSCDASYYRWLYTALTRATEKVHLVNWPEKQTEV